MSSRPIGGRAGARERFPEKKVFYKAVKLCAWAENTPYATILKTHPGGPTRRDEQPRLFRHAGPLPSCCRWWLPAICSSTQNMAGLGRWYRFKRAGAGGGERKAYFGDWANVICCWFYVGRPVAERGTLLAGDRRMVPDMISARFRSSPHGVHPRVPLPVTG